MFAPCVCIPGTRFAGTKLGGGAAAAVALEDIVREAEHTGHREEHIVLNGTTLTAVMRSLAASAFACGSACSSSRLWNWAQRNPKSGAPLRVVHPETACHVHIAVSTLCSSNKPDSILEAPQ